MALLSDFFKDFLGLLANCTRNVLEYALGFYLYTVRAKL